MVFLDEVQTLKTLPQIQMLSEKNIVVTIGNYGAVIALHSGGKIESKAFIAEFDDNARNQIAEICLAHKTTPIYVLLDTIDQSYKKKIYPSVRKSDLTRIVKRDLATDGDTSVLKGYMILNKKKPSGAKQAATNRWECLFISSSDSDLINRWVDYLVELPNHLIGIYMSPVETFGLFQSLQSNIKNLSKTKNKHNELYCILLQNQVSGIRQIVFSSQGIVFTRVVNYDFDQADFLEKYEHDIYSTFEYLKRIFPNLVISELDIVNIFSERVLSILGKLSNAELNFVNYTPNTAAAKIGISAAVDRDSDFCDFLISKVFSKGKKILRFTTPKILVLEKFFLTIKASYYLNLVLVVLIIATGVITLLSQDKIAQSVEAAETQRYTVNQELAKLKKLAFEGATISSKDQIISAERVIDFGKVDEVLNLKNNTFFDYYTKLKFLKEDGVKIGLFFYSINNFNSKSPSINNNCQIVFSGKLSNSTGDIDDLFRKFDALTRSIKKAFASDQIKYDELPRTLDFTTKYLTYPVDFTITSGPSNSPSSPPQ